MVTVLNYWTDEVPKAAWISIFWVVIILINIWVVKFFAEVEVFASTVKFGWMIIAIISLIGQFCSYLTLEALYTYTDCHFQQL